MSMRPTRAEGAGARRGEGDPLVVAWVVGQYPSLTESFVDREREALERIGVKVVIVALRTGRRDDTAEGGAGRLGTRLVSRSSPGLCLASHLRALWRRPARCVRCGLRAAGLLLAAPRLAPATLRAWWRAPAWARELEAWGVRHLHAHFAYVTADAASLLSCLLRLPYSVSVHAWDLYAQKPGEVRRRLKGASLVIACTEQGRRRARDLLPPSLSERVYRVRHPAPRLPPDDRPAERRPLVLAVGRLVPKKGFASFVDACSLLLQKNPGVQAVIVGEGPCREALAARIGDRNLSGAVALAGALPREEVQRLIASAAVVVVPSVIAPDGDRDGLPNVILEAMAVGTPVVASTASAAPEIIRDGRNGFLVPPHRPDAIAECVERLLKDPDVARRIGRAARESLEPEFDAERNARTLRDLWLGRTSPEVSDRREEPAG